MFHGHVRRPPQLGASLGAFGTFMLLCVARFGPIEYKGPFVAPYMESFILRVITPLTYLPSRARLKDFLSNHEV